MTVTNSPPTPSPRAEPCRCAARCLLPAALLALAPKCVLCVLAYAGIGAALGVNGVEICGGPTDAPGTWPSLLAWLGVGGAVSAWGVLAHSRHPIGKEVSVPGIRGSTPIRRIAGCAD